MNVQSIEARREHRAGLGRAVVRPAAAGAFAFAELEPAPNPLRLEPRRPEPAGKAFVAESAPMRRLLSEVALVAPKDVTVLVRGETGTGKELVASMVHAQSRRADGPLVRFNCGAIAEELAEAELFGHARGAFTGATQSRRGFFAEADGGTIVLDEIGELPLRLQPKLLRALQDGEIQPVGSARVERVDVRVVASTHRDLAAEVHAGRFREDLYYRLAVVELIIPPLREHRADIPALVDEFTRRYARRFGVEGVTLSQALVEKLLEADWPGNVRQLENAVARMVALCAGGVLGPEAFAAPAPAPAPEPPAANARDHEGGADLPAATEAGGGSLREQLDALERALIITTLMATRGNQTETARRLGLGRTSLFERMKKHGLRGSRSVERPGSSAA